MKHNKANYATQIKLQNHV